MKDPRRKNMACVEFYADESNLFSCSNEGACEGGGDTNDCLGDNFVIADCLIVLLVTCGS